MEQTKNIMTYEGMRALEDELQNLKVVSRKAVAEKIKEAKEQGDISENAEYDAALDEQRDIEARIEEIEKELKYAVVISTEDAEADKVSIGSTVSVLDVEFDEEMTFRIVGSSESNILGGKIAYDSPVGKALIGRSTGEIVTAETPDGEAQFKILSIDHSN